MRTYKYSLIRINLQTNEQVCVSKSKNIHYLDKKMENEFCNVVEQLTTNRDRSYFVNDSCYIQGLFRWQIIENIN